MFSSFSDAKVHKNQKERLIVKKKYDSLIFHLKVYLYFPNMSTEIERKFLVCGDFIDQATEVTEIVQGYLSSSPDRTVRVRVRGEKGYITVKGLADDSGIARYEWEKEIPVDDARELLKLCEPTPVEKTRYLVHYGRHSFEVDVFHGANSGLVMAEIELLTADEAFEKPPWLGEEVSGDPRYYNSALSVKPYSRW
jgi:CYTH domain-containing protein